jgi:Mycothiol maleylpyruvate isomerase N-terminal domain
LKPVQETPVGAKSEALAQQLETKVRDALATLEGLGDQDWKRTTGAEQWSVGVTAHHLAGALEPVSHMAEAVVAGESGSLTGPMLDEMNAAHARDHAQCTKAETLELLRRGAIVAARVIRGLRDDQLAKTATVLTDVPPMSAEELIRRGLLAHMDEHFGSIRKAVGRT